jgi:CubicO group peptidase (beta-lactamase class C family)
MSHAHAQQPNRVMRALLVLVAALLALAVDLSASTLGPGRGPWQRASPESQGLSSDLLELAEERTNEEMGGDRLCTVVIKNGYLVYERYRRGHTESSLYGAWSATKSLCPLLYGVAVQQGWADPSDLVRDRNSNTRQCNADTSFRHVMTMTGFSDPATPEWIYDGDGIACLDTLADFVDQNNPEGLSGAAWKDKYFWDALGMEDSVWTDGPGVPVPGENFPCGWGVEASCRDLARAGQLLANDGEWEGEGQLVDRQFTIDSRRWIYPQVQPPVSAAHPFMLQPPALVRVRGRELCETSATELLHAWRGCCPLTAALLLR